MIQFLRGFVLCSFISLISMLSTQAEVLADTQALAENHQDFAYGISIQLKAQQIYEFEVPDAVYQHSQTANLSDLRIFDSSNNSSLAYAVLSPAALNAPALIETKALTVFVLPRNTRDATPDDLRVSVQRDTNGQILQINTANMSTSTSTHESQSDYLLDLGDTQQKKPQQLQIIWNADQIPQAQVNLQNSDDLLQWRNIGSGALVHIQQADQTLQTDKISLNTQQRYLKISSETPALQLQTITGLYLTQPDRPNQRRWQGATFLQFDTQKNRYHYTLPPALSVVALRIIPAANTTLKNVQLTYSQTENQHQYLPPQDWYRFNVQDQLQQSPELPTPNIQAKHWFITLEKNAPTLTPPPQLQVAWQAARIRFLSAAAGDYLIAYGSQINQTPSPTLPHALQKPDLEIITLNLPSAITLGGETALKPARNYRSLILWGVLISALIMLGAIARSLLKSNMTKP